MCEYRAVVLGSTRGTRPRRKSWRDACPPPFRRVVTRCPSPTCRALAIDFPPPRARKSFGPRRSQESGGLLHQLRDRVTEQVARTQRGYKDEKQFERMGYLRTRTTCMGKEASRKV